MTDDNLDFVLRTSPDHDCYPIKGDPLACVLVEVRGRIRQGTKDRELQTQQRVTRTDTVLVLDVSRSMDRPDKYPLVRSATAMLASHLGAKDRLAAILFSTGSDAVLGLGGPCPGPETLAVRMDASQIRHGGTNLAPGLLRALEELQSAGRIPARVYCLTDGQIFDAGAARPLILALSEFGATVQFFGFGENWDIHQLQLLANLTPDGWVKPILNTEDVERIFGRIGETAAGTIAARVYVHFDFAPAVVCGDFFRFRPIEKHLGSLTSGSSDTIRAFEDVRTYSWLLEVRLPTDSGTAEIGQVTIQGDAESVAPTVWSISIPRGNALGKPCDRAIRARDILHGLRDNSPGTELKRYQAMVSLYREEKRDPELILALERRIGVLQDPETEQMPPDAIQHDERLIRAAPRSAQPAPPSSRLHGLLSRSGLNFEDDPSTNRDLQPPPPPLRRR
jgi:hypothetical protein